MRLKSEQRLLLGKLARTNIAKNVLMVSFSVSRTTVWYWGKQNLHYTADITRIYESKITIDAEASILFFRSLGYGTARIQQRLVCAPKFELKKMEISVQKLFVSRQTINKVLKKHKINGYKSRKRKAWKFFRAKYANELWQLDLKQFKFEGKKYYFLVCIDDYSRFLLLIHQFDHAPKIEEIEKSVEHLIEKYAPKSILTDNNPFGKEWKIWCQYQNVKAIFAHPYYPQDKGKVERAIRNIAEELINLIIIFHKLFNKNEMLDWINWFNEKRFHRGIKDFPDNLYVKI